MRLRSVFGYGVVALAALTLGCGADDLLGPDALQGIDGMVLLGPLCPVMSEDNPCPDRPYQAWIAIRHPTGGLVTRVRSEQDGTFLIGLRPGVYVLDPESGDPFPMATEQEVTVVEGIYTEVVVSFDTGIR